MFAIPFASCFAATCAVTFGTADWTKTYTGQSFQVGYYTIILMHVDPSDANKNKLKKIIGDKPVICVGLGANRRKFVANCYVNGPGINEYLDVSAEINH